jgi:hypothetical protein
MRLLLVVLLVGVPVAGSDEDPSEVLMRLRDQVVLHGQRIPNHTCVETIERDRFTPAVEPVPKSCESLLARRKQSNLPAMIRLATTDRLRLDVAMADSREIFSWAGASKFEEGEIDELVPDGAMATGPFATMLFGVFQGRAPKFIFEGETTLDQRSVFEYSYEVGIEEAHYRVKARGEWLFTGYSGTLWVDTQTAELVRLLVRTDELPAATGLCETDTTLDYSLVHLDKDDYLLPKATRQRFIERGGGEAENRIAFSACREYRGESTLSFGRRKDAAASAVPAAPQTADLPPGLPVIIELTDSIHGDRAAAGDLIGGRLLQPIRDQAGAVLAPAGAALEGRLMRLETRHGRSPETVVSLRWETLEIGGTKVALSLLPKRKTADLKTPATGVRQRGIEIELPAPSDVRHGVYHFPGEHPVVESGYRTEWTTAGP